MFSIDNYGGSLPRRDNTDPPDYEYSSFIVPSARPGCGCCNRYQSLGLSNRASPEISQTAPARTFLVPLKIENEQTVEGHYPKAGSTLFRGLNAFFGIYQAHTLRVDVELP